MKTSTTLRNAALLPERAAANRPTIVRAGRALAKVTLVLIVAIMAIRGVGEWFDLAQIQQERLRGQDEASSLEDYVTFYAAGKLVLQGRGEDLYNIDAISAVEREAMGRPVGGTGILAYFNPPFVAAVFAPLSVLSVGVFSTVLLGIILATVAAGGLLMQRFLHLSTVRQTACFWLLFLSVHATVWLAVEEQLSMFLLSGWLGFAWAQSRGKQRASGFALALVLVKPQMALLPVALLVWNREWQALQAFGVVAVSLVVTSILISGPAVLIDYPRFLIHTTGWESQGVSTASMMGLNGLVARLIGDRSPSQLLVLPLVLPALAAAAYAWKSGWQPRTPRFFLQVGITLLAALLINPHLYMQDLVLLGLVLVLCVTYSRSAGLGFGPWPLITIGVWFVLMQGGRLQFEYGIPLVALTMIGLMVFALRTLKHVEAQEVQAPNDVYLAPAA